MLDPRLYILGGLAFLAVVSAVYLVVAIVGYFAGRVRARRGRANAAASPEIGVTPEPIVPIGPAPVLESDPFAPAVFAPAPVAPAMPVEPAPVESAPVPPDEAERIARRLASLERQAELGIQAAQPAAVPAPAPQPAPAPTHAPAPESSASAVPPSPPAPAAPAPAPSPPEPAPSTAEIAPPPPEYRLVAPVELHFTEGGGRIGVRPGTRTHDEFQRLARALLGELRDARSRSQQ